MKYSKIQYIWGTGVADKITIPLTPVLPTNPYVVESITGLEPPEITLGLGEQLFEGSAYQGSRTTNREIVTLLSFQPNYSIGEDAGVLRKRLYRLLSPRKTNHIIFRLLTSDETEYVQTVGRIKRIEANPFSADPQTQITMECFTPYFTQPEITYPSPATLNGTSLWTITNPGDAPMGFFLNIVITATQTHLRLTNNETGEYFQFNAPLVANDRILINTYPGSKSIVRQRSGVADFNLLGNMHSTSTWMDLDPGVNTITPSYNTYTVTALRYTPRHWGF